MTIFLAKILLWIKFIEVKMKYTKQIYKYIFFVEVTKNAGTSVSQTIEENGSKSASSGSTSLSADFNQRWENNSLDS